MLHDDDNNLFIDLCHKQLASAPCASGIQVICDHLWSTMKYAHLLYDIIVFSDVHQFTQINDSEIK